MSRVVETMLALVSRPETDGAAGDAIIALREALNAVSGTHDEMLALFQEMNDLEDEIDDGPTA